MSHRILLLFLLLSISASAAPFLAEEFETDPIAAGRFDQVTTNTESSFSYSPTDKNLQALLDVDSSSAHYLSKPLGSITDKDSLSFSFVFRVADFDDRVTPTAFIGLMTDRHVEDFGDGLTLVLSTSQGRLVANANIDQGDFRTSGDTLDLEFGLLYRAVSRYNARTRQFSTAVFGGTNFTNLVGISATSLPQDRQFLVNRMGLQNGGAALDDQEVGSLLLTVDALRMPAHGPPILTIENATVVEGNSGTRAVSVPVVLSYPTDEEVTVTFSSADLAAALRAIAGVDYAPVSGKLTLPPGSISSSINVVVTGDLLIEPDESFLVSITAVTHAILFENEAIVTIINDDGLAGRLDHFEWGAINSPQGLGVPFGVVVTAKDAQNQTVRDFGGTVALEASPLREDRVVGGGTLNWIYPLASANHDARTQVIYLASELGGAGQIRGLSLYVIGTPGRTLSGWLIRIKPTNLSRYGASPVWENSGWTTVYSNNETINGSGWVTFVFSNPFAYDGVSNLLVDYSFNTAATGRNGSCWATDGGQVRSLSFASNSANGSPVSWAARTPVPVTSTLVPNAKFMMEHVVRMSPVRSGNFVGGVWRGDLTVLEAARDMTVLADDGVEHQGRSNPFTVGVLGDLAVSLVAEPGVVRLGQMLTYNATVKNLGLTRISGVVLTNRLPAEVSFVSASGGGVAEGSDVVCTLGNLDPGAAVTVQIMVQTTGTGTITNRAKVTGQEFDSDLSNNVATAVAVVNPPVIVIRDVGVVEGDSGTVEAVFEVRMSMADKEVKVDYGTADGTAKSGSDYESRSGTLTFPLGMTTNYVRVLVKGDTLPEDTESFVVNLSNPINATLQDAQGIGTITDDEVLGISIATASEIEGNNGLAEVLFTVSLYSSSKQTVDVEYSTTEGTATSGVDYVPVGGRLIFTPGITNQTIGVKIKSDTLHELDETFWVELSNPRGAALGKSRALGVILNDDFPEITITDSTINLAISGTSNAVLIARLSYPSLQHIQLDYATTNGTAVKPTDYDEQFGTLLFPPGMTEVRIPIPILANTRDETNEYFYVNLSKAVQATFADAQGKVTILNERGNNNSPPTISLIVDQTTLEDTPAAAVLFTVGDAETPPSNLMVDVASSNLALVPKTNITLNGTGANRTLVARPAPDEFGETAITITAADAEGALSTRSFRLLVRPVNDPPSFLKGADQTAEDKVGLQTIRNWANDLRAGPPNEIDQTLTFQVTNDTPGLFVTPPNISPSGTLTFEPAMNSKGTAKVTVVLRDSGGTADGGIDSSQPENFLITAVHRNQPPTISDILDQTLRAGEATLPIPFEVADLETPAADLRLSVTSSDTVFVPASALAFGGSGTNRTITVTPALNRIGSAVVTVTVADAEGLTANDSFRLTVLAVPTNRPPIVSIIRPLNGTEFTFPATIVINAEARDPDSGDTIANVEFFQGAVKLGEARTIPYTVVWSNVAAGNYTLTAKATDNKGAPGTSDPVTISVVPPTTPGNSPPTVSISAPADRTIFQDGDPISIVATANDPDPDGRVDRVEFFAGSIKLGEVSTLPYRLLWIGAKEGHYVLTARAVDDKGATGESAPVRIVVSKACTQIAIVSNADDSEMPNLVEYLYEIGVKAFVFDRLEAAREATVEAQLEKFTNFGVVIWNDMGRSGLSEREVNLFDALANPRLGKGLYYIGDALVSSAQQLGSVQQTKWFELIHLTAKSGLGVQTRVELDIALGDAVVGPRGKVGTVQNFNYQFPDQGVEQTHSPEELVWGRAGSSDVLVAFEKSTTGVSGRRITQAFRVANGGDDASKAERKKLFQNAVWWLMKCVCDNLNMTILDNGSPTSANVGEELTYAVKVSQAGGCEALFVTASSILPPGLKFLEASSEIGVWAINNGVVSFALGKLARGAEVNLQIRAQILQGGVFTNAWQMRSLNESDGAHHDNSVEIVTQVEGPGESPLTLSAKVGASGSIELTLRGPPDQTIVVESSADLLTWSLVRTVVLTNGRAVFVDLNSNGSRQRFYRVTNGP